MKKRNIIIVTAAVFLMVATIVFLNILPMIKMRPVKTGYIPNTNIYAVNNGVNSLFFIKIKNEYIVVDAGTNIDKINKSLNEANIDPMDVKYLLLTHSDYDHVGSLSLFKNAEIYIGEDEMQMLDGTVKRNKIQNNSLPSDIKPENLNLLKDNQKLTIGDCEIECIKVPGHTPGSMVYIFNDEFMFTGDAFMIEKNSIKPHPFTMDSELAMQSIKKLNDIKCDLIITAHYGFYESGNIQNRNNR